MSRSHRKTMIIKDGSSVHRRFAKRAANRSVRYAEDVPNGKQYRKYYPQWGIYDYIHYWPKAEWTFKWEHRHDAHHKYWHRPQRDTKHDHMRYWYSRVYWK